MKKMSGNPTYWKMRNGESISIDDMDLNHLRNVLKMIVRNSNKSKVTRLDNIEQSFNEEAINQIENDYYDTEESMLYGNNDLNL